MHFLRRLTRSIFRIRTPVSPVAGNCTSGPSASRTCPALFLGLAFLIIYDFLSNVDFYFIFIHYFFLFPNINQVNQLIQYSLFIVIHHFFIMAFSSIQEPINQSNHKALKYKV